MEGVSKYWPTKVQSNIRNEKCCPDAPAAAVCVSLRGAPVDSEITWSGNLLLKNVFLKLQNYWDSIFFGETIFFCFGYMKYPFPCIIASRARMTTTVCHISAHLGCDTILALLVWSKKNYILWIYSQSILPIPF